MVHDYLLGGAVVVIAYLAFVLVWSMVESVVIIARTVRRWGGRRRNSRGGHVRVSSSTMAELYRPFRHQ